MASCSVRWQRLTRISSLSQQSLAANTRPLGARTRRFRARLGRSALIGTLILIGAASHASAAVAVENTAEVGNAAAGTTVTIAAFNPSFRSNLVLVVGLSFGGGIPGSVSVTFGGVPLTLVPGTSRTSTDNLQHTELRYLVNPSTTPADIVASWTGTLGYAMGAVSFSGVDQTTPVRNGTFATGTSTTTSVTITSAAGDMTMDTVSENSGVAPYLSTSTQTQRWVDTVMPNENAGGSTAAGAATVTHAWTNGSSVPWVSSGVDIKAAAILAARSGYKVGSFTKKTSGLPDNCPAACSQTIPHGLGQVPKALILWTDGAVGSSVTAGYDFAIGFTDGTTSGSAASAAQDAVGTPATARRNANRVLTIVNPSQTLLTEATFSSWDSTNVTLSWTPNDSNAYVIHYIAIGGSDVSAQVINWQMPTSTGNKAVTGLSFQPTVAIHIHSGSGATGTPPSTAATSAVGLGVMDFGGHQWSSTTYSANGTTPSDTERLQLNNAALVSGGVSITKQATFVSMDAGGFTMNFTTASGGAGQVFTLALAGVNVQAGSFLKSASAAIPTATFVQQAATSATATTVAQTFPAVSTTGNLIVVSLNVGSSTANVSSVTDQKGNTYTRAAGPTLWSASSSRVSTYYASNITGGGAAITITATLDASAFVELYQLEYSGVLPMNPLDQVSVGTGTVAAMDSGSKTTTYPNELIYGFGMSCGTATIGGTFTARSTFDSNFVGDKSVAAAGIYNVNGTDSCGGWADQMLTFKVGRAQSITGLGFLPSAVLFKSFQDVPNAAGEAQSRQGFGASDGTTQGSSAFVEQNTVTPSVVKSIDKTTKAFMKVNNNTATVDAEADLTSMDADGFTLAWTTNDAVATEILYLAIAPLAVTEVKLISFTATTYGRGALLQWRTGAELNNLGFNLYREVNGVRTKVNPSLIAGSGLVAGRGTAVNAAESYARWDLDSAATSGAVVYWLEDLDFNGTSTFHGPITPVAGALNAPEPTVTPSSDLKDLGKGTTNASVFVTHNDVPVLGGLGMLSAQPSSQTAQPSSQIQNQWALAAQTLVKIGIRSPGWYRVAQADLVAAGLNPGVDSRTLRLFVDGIEQAIRVTGNADGGFHPGDAIEFYGTGVDTPYTDTRVYFLASGGDRGLRIGVEGGASSATQGPTSFWSTMQRKDRSVYFAALNNGDAENWFGPIVSTASSPQTDLTLTADQIDPAAPDPAQLTVTLQGVTTASDGNAGHQVAVLVNGTDIGEMDFQGQTHATQTFAVPAGVLLGENHVTLIARGGDMDVSLVDVLRLGYWHTYRADADLLRFTVATPGPVTVGGFASQAIRVVDLSDPSAISELPGAVQPDSGGLWAVTVQVTGTGPRTLLAFSDATIGTPAFVRANHPSSWHSRAQAHDYVVISHADFIGQVKPLAALREQQGHRAAVIDVADLYDEFSFGEKTPQALRDFLQWARANWRKPPQFVVLVGDATIDPRDYAQLGDADFVPTKQVSMVQVALKTASDDWFVDFNGDGLPDVPIGRLSVRSATQAAAVVAKIVSYDQGSPQPWTKDVLLVADQNDDTSNFEQLTADLSARLPADYTAHQVFRGALGDAVAHQTIIDRVSNGQLLVNYAGHGSVGLWGSNGELLTNADVTSWQNRTRLPFVVAMNCLNGLFDQIYDEESLAEALQRAPNGGAVAVWASSSVTSAATQALVDQELFRLIFRGTYATLGEAVAAAKRVVSSPDLRRSWIFFGDPAMRLSGSPQPVGPQNVPSPTVRAGDFDGDGKADMTVFRPSTGVWYTLQSNANYTTSGVVAWGLGTDKPVPGDYDGDGKTDPAVFRPSTGIWYILNSSTNYTTSMASRWGVSTDVPVPADYDGDGKTDPAVYRPSTGQWFILMSSTNYTSSMVFTWGVGADVPLPGDYDGDGQADLAVYRPSTGVWYILQSSTNYTISIVVTWGVGADFPVPADYDGDGRTDPAMYRPSTGQWLILMSSTHYTSSMAFTWGVSTDVPLPGDYDSDGKADPAVYRPSTGVWYFLKSSTNYMTNGVVTWGASTDTPTNGRP